MASDQRYLVQPNLYETPIYKTAIQPQADVMLVQPEQYDKRLIAAYERAVGNNSFRWYVRSTDSPTLPGWNYNPTNAGWISISDNNLNAYEYDLSRAVILLSFQLCTSGSQQNGYNANPLPAGAYVSPCPDCWFSQIQFRIGSTELSAQQGKQYMHKTAHLIKLMTYTPYYANLVAGYEFFYRDTGVDASATTQPFNHFCSTVTVGAGTYNTTAATTNTVQAWCGTLPNTTGVPFPAPASAGNGTAGSAQFMVVGGGNTATGLASATTYGGAWASQPTTLNTNGIPTPIDVMAGVGGIAGTVNADGNPYNNITPNLKYNDGFRQRCLVTGVNSVTSGGNYNTIVVPLIYYIRALEIFRATTSGIAYQMMLQRPPDYETMFSANNATAGNAISNPLPANAGVRIVDMKLCIPAYTPSAEWAGKLQERLNAGTVSVRKYVDCDLYPYTTQLTSGMTSFNVVFPAVSNRRPVAALLALQFASDHLQTQMGNTHRYIPFGVSTAQLQYGASTFYPPDGRYTINSMYNDNVTLYRDFMKVCDIVTGNTANCISYQDFVTHKYFVPFDLREIPPTGLPNGQSVNISIDVSFLGPVGSGQPLGASGGIPATPASIDSAGSKLPPFYGGTDNGRFSGTWQSGPPINGVIVWLFLFQERGVKLTETAAGVEITPDYDSI